jgi:hypothetical protein
VTRMELKDVIKEQMAESGVDDDNFADDLADRLDTQFGLIDEEDDDQDDFDFDEEEE